MDSITDDIKIYKTKIVLLNEQIKLRESIPENERTAKQAIKLDNIKYELTKIYQLLDAFTYNNIN
jgi:hypothetical protein